MSNDDWSFSGTYTSTLNAAFVQSQPNEQFVDRIKSIRKQREDEVKIDRNGKRERRKYIATLERSGREWYIGKLNGEKLSKKFGDDPRNWVGIWVKWGYRRPLWALALSFWNASLPSQTPL
jgi:hypothetical protein